MPVTVKAWLTKAGTAYYSAYGMLIAGMKWTGFLGLMGDRVHANSLKSSLYEPKLKGRSGFYPYLLHESAIS